MNGHGVHAQIIQDKLQSHGGHAGVDEDEDSVAVELIEYVDEIDVLS